MGQCGPKKQNDSNMITRCLNNKILYAILFGFLLLLDYYLDTHYIAGCEEITFSIQNTPWATTIEINPEVARSSFRAFDREIFVSTRQVHDTYSLEVAFNVSPEELVEMLKAVQDKVCSNKGKVGLGITAFIVICYIVGLAAGD